MAKDKKQTIGWLDSIRSIAGERSKQPSETKHWSNLYFLEDEADKAYGLISVSHNGESPTTFRSDEDHCIRLLKDPNEYPTKVMDGKLETIQDYSLVGLLEELSGYLESEQVAILMDRPRYNSTARKSFVNYVVLGKSDYNPI